jgi:hypothetical protein
MGVRCRGRSWPDVAALTSVVRRCRVRPPVTARMTNRQEVLATSEQWTTAMIAKG